MAFITSRRTFLQAVGAGTIALGAAPALLAAEKPIQGF
jgi:hypothetical protein